MSEKLRVLDLFSGIGGFSLGLERTSGFETVAFCEIEPYCRAVLRKHWPHVRQYDDVRTLTAEQLRADGISVDVICGGFPCQDISNAGRQAGITGERSGLWSELVRLIGDIRPRYAIVENVANLLAGPSERRGEWFGVVLGDLASIGFDAEWHCIPAAAVGAPHLRDRVWIVAYPGSKQHEGCGNALGRQGTEKLPQASLADANGGLHTRELDGGADCRAARAGEGGNRGKGQAPYGERVWDQSRSGREVVADAAGERRGEAREYIQRHSEWLAGGSSILGHATGPRLADVRWGQAVAQSIGLRAPSDPSRWDIEPDVGRVADGVPSRVDRLKSLGNSVVPDIPEIIGRAILKAEEERIAA